MERRSPAGLAALLIAVTALAAPLRAAEPTTVKLTDKVLVSDVERLGVHFSGDNFYDSAILKLRVAQNFEGTVRRLHLLGPGNQPEADGLYLWKSFDPGMTAWTGATYHVLAGPDQWQTGKVVAIEERAHDVRKRGKPEKVCFVRLDKPVDWHKDVNGLLLQGSDLDSGQHPWTELRRTKVDGKVMRRFETDTRWCSPERNELVHGDTPPGSFGNTAMKLVGATEPAFLMFRTQFYNAAPFDGPWTVRFWARAAAGTPELTVKPTVPGSGVKLAPPSEWTHYTQTIAMDKPPADQNPIAFIDFRVTGGDLLIDDVEALQPQKDKNPTPFRDSLVETLKPLRPGSMRYLRNTCDTVMNSVRPAIRTYSMGGRAKGRSEFGAHEFFELCEYLECSAWATLPGTILPEEIDHYMEYIGAPADVGYGKLRAELGHPKPWTETLKNIHVQFGNEPVTFFGTGFFGPDYWKALIARAKTSPFYKPNVVFIVNEQGRGAHAALEWSPNADRLCVNGYMIFAIYRDQIERAKDLPGFYDWVFAQTWHNWFGEVHNKNAHALAASRKFGKEIAIYEGGNYHTTFGDEDKPLFNEINHMITGMAGGMNATHSMLVLLKHAGARTQESFNLSQYSFKPGGAFGNLPGRVRVWGGVLGIGNPDRRRYRPRFLALQLANQVMGGDLVETVHSGADPNFTVTNRFGAGYGPSRRPKLLTVGDIPRIHSYGFREGKRRGLILVSNDPRDAHTITVKFDGKAAGAKAESWTLVGEKLESSNEYDFAPDGPQVTVRKDDIRPFASGAEFTLRPASMIAVQWAVE
jgi:hypothetical protein